MTSELCEHIKITLQYIQGHPLAPEEMQVLIGMIRNQMLGVIEDVQRLEALHKLVDKYKRNLPKPMTKQFETLFFDIPF